MSTEDIAIEREVARIDRPGEAPGRVPGHRARRLIEGDDPGFSDPFLVMAEDWMPRGAFPRHPHRGIETVTYVINGAVEHFDSAGHSGRLGPGDVQWMTAGRGVLHEENAPEGVVAHTLQIWVNLPSAAKMIEPRYQNLIGADMPVRREPGVEARVFSGRSGDVVSDTANHAPVTMIDAQIAPGATFTQDMPGADNGFLFVIQGSVAVGSADTLVDGGSLAWLTRSDATAGSRVTLTATTTPARVLILSGRPIAEPVVFGGPFVMNSQEEIRQAFADYKAGLF